jgi:SAM-dependent methyltransferase
MAIKKGKKLDFTIADVVEVYSSFGGVLWEMLMGEQIHVGGESETTILAQKAGINEGTSVLDVCCALGGPARQLARTYGCKVIGLDATQRMLEEAITRTAKMGLASQVTYKLGNALTEEEWIALNSFMAFRYVETLAGYTDELKRLGCTILETTDVSSDFAERCHMYNGILKTKLKSNIIKEYGPALYRQADDGLQKWVRAADEKKMGRGRIVARK